MRLFFFWVTAFLSTYSFAYLKSNSLENFLSPLTWNNSTKASSTNGPIKDNPLIGPSLASLLKMPEGKKCLDGQCGCSIKPSLPTIQELLAFNSSSQTYPTIWTPNENIPDFGYGANIVSINDGNWSDPNTWNLGRVPRSNDVVSISSGTRVIYDVVSDERIYTVCVGPQGTLQFRTDIDTKLIVTNFLVKYEGALLIGTWQQPMHPNATAEVIFSDDTIELTGDPAQFGTGLIVLGTISVIGTWDMYPTYAQLARNAMPDDTTIELGEDVEGWKINQEICFSSTEANQYAEHVPGIERHAQTRRITGISGRTITLDRPLEYAYKGAPDADGNIAPEHYPIVGNLTRNVIFRSENPTGTRGHTMFTHRATVMVYGARFKDLGRTRFGALDPVFNRKGRYSVHCHHLWGPENSDGTQYYFMHNAIDGSLKWATSFHNSHYGYISDNVIYGVQTAGLVCEDGNEKENYFVRNFICNVGGRTDGASGIWSLGAAPSFFYANKIQGNYVFNDENVNPAGNGGVGFWFDALSRTSNDMHREPKWPGADMTDDSQVNFVYPYLTMSYLWANWGLGMDGFIYVDHQVGPGFQEAYFFDTTALSCRSGAANAYDSSITFVGVVARNCDIGWIQNSSSDPIVMTDVDIQSNRPDCVGLLHMSGAGQQYLIVHNARFRNATNVKFGLALATGAWVDPDAGKWLILDDIRFEAPPGMPLVAIDLQYTLWGPSSPSRVPCQENKVLVYNSNLFPGQNFQAFFNEQDQNFIVPCEEDLPNEPGVNVRRSIPERGLTNAQSWLHYQMAIGGQIMPPDAFEHPAILNGKVAFLP